MKIDGGLDSIAYNRRVLELKLKAMGKWFVHNLEYQYGKEELQNRVFSIKQTRRK